MDLSPNWAPSKDGSALAPCYLTEKWSNEVPSTVDLVNEVWSSSALRAHLDEAKGDRKAVWQAVLGIWRLKIAVEKGPVDTSWMEHMSAWLVSQFSCRGPFT